MKDFSLRACPSVVRPMVRNLTGPFSQVSSISVFSNVGHIPQRELGMILDSTLTCLILKLFPL